jgi:hypothetical protein
LGIVRFALKYPHTFYVVAALILFLGVTAVVEMPTDIFPEIDIPVVSVIWQYTGLNTTEMEQRFTTNGRRSRGACGCSNPSTGMFLPLIQWARGDARKAMTSATSSAVPRRSIGKPWRT